MAEHDESHCHPLIGMRVVVIDGPPVCVQRTGVIRHDPMFGTDYLSFDDGGSVDPEAVVLDVGTPYDERISRSPVPKITAAHLAARSRLLRRDKESSDG